jgi:hypothetical protein
MAVRAAGEYIIDTIRDVPSRCRDGWDRVRYSSWRSRAMVFGAVVAVAALTGVVVTVVNRPDAVDDADVVADVLVVQSQADLPATTWSGWTQRPLTARPAVAEPAAGMTAQPQGCIPGGVAQQRAQQPSVSGSAWVGTEFTNQAMAARASAMIARNRMDIAAGMDGWLASCGHVLVTDGDVRAAVDVKAIGIDAKTYRLDEARLVAQSVTPQVANARTATTALTAIGRSDDYVLTVTMSIPGSITDEAITTLDTLWRAQAAKLVGYQQAGKL